MAPCIQHEVNKPEGLLPTLLAFDIPPRYSPPGLDADLPKQRQLHRAVNVARDEYLRIANGLRIGSALR